MRVLRPQHPLLDHKLTILRDGRTQRAEFVRALHDVGIIVGLEVTRDLVTQRTQIDTPLERTEVTMLAEPLPVLVPILRAGLGLLPALQELIPNTEVGFLGLKRDEKTHISTTYASRLPAELTGRHCIVLDPMIASGGSLNSAINALFDRGVASVAVVSAVASPEGIRALEEEQATRAVTVGVGVIDRELNADAYIVPGIGDAGDRLFGVTGS